MRCYYHPDRDAVAICKSCQRALCMECTADVPPGIACRGKCEADVAAVNLVVERSKTSFRKAGAAYYGNAIAMLLVGLMTMAFSIVPAFLYQEYSALLLAPFGGVLLLWSFLSYRNGRQITRVDPKNER